LKVRAVAKDVGISPQKVRLAIGTVKGKRVDEALTCLLYTSPSPRDATLSRMPSSA